MSMHGKVEVVGPLTLPNLPVLAGSGALYSGRLSNGFGVFWQRHRLSHDLETTIPGQDLLKFHIQLSGQRTLKFQNRHETDLYGAATSILMHDAGVSKVERLLAGADERSVTMSI